MPLKFLYCCVAIVDWYKTQNITTLHVIKDYFSLVQYSWGRQYRASVVARLHNITQGQKLLLSHCSTLPLKPFLSVQNRSLSHLCSKNGIEKGWSMKHTFLSNTSQILYPPGLLISHWPDISHVATPNWKEGKKSSLYSKKSVAIISLKGGENKNLSTTSISHSFIWQP